MKTIKNPLIYLALAALSFSACNPKQETKVADNKVGEVTDTLSLADAWRYVHNFDKFSTAIDEKTGELNTRAIWFSKKRLESILKRLEEDNGDGVRFYYATYDKFNGSGKPGELGHNTLVLASTYADGKLHRDSYWRKPGENGPKGFIVGAPPENRGEMCPPPKACDSVGAGLLVPDPSAIQKMK